MFYQVTLDPSHSDGSRGDHLTLIAHSDGTLEVKSIFCGNLEKKILVIWLGLVWAP